MAKTLIGTYEATIYPEGKGYTGAISLGFAPDGTRQRLKRKGRTKALVKDKLIKAVKDLEAGITASESYTVRDAVHDWLSKGLKGRSENTVTKLRILAETRLDELAGELATSTLREIHSVLKRAIRQAQARDMVLRNAAELVTTPKGTDGRPSKALNRQQAETVLKTAASSELHAYVVISLTTGIRTEEARALCWDHVVAWVHDLKSWLPVTEVGFQHKKFAIYVWRADRDGGDTKTRKSRRTLELPKLAVQALRLHHVRQAAQKLQVGEAWQDRNLVFCSNVGTPLDAANVRRSFRRITKSAGIGTTWTPRELRHSFVSIMSDQGVPIETIADIVGHAGTSVTETVYRHQLRPVITKGAQTMNIIFGDSRHG
ncbi:site-specific integrase [Nonomuraea sp. NPDC049152]|uniref:site-specific integrase n=1 Tax=Nonomuraea sp. NPDC049152 TaxID=3154350 RepID=UPI0033E9A269